MINRNIGERISTDFHTILAQTISQRCSYQKNVINDRHKQKPRKPIIQDEEDIERKWVVNLSQRNLSKDEISLLRKGLNYAITLRNIPTKEIFASVKEGISRLLKNDQDNVGSEIYSTLKGAKPPVQQNLRHDERKALKDLKTASDIVIVQADKGNATVVMDRRTRIMHKYKKCYKTRIPIRRLLISDETQLQKLNWNCKRHC